MAASGSKRVVYAALVGNGLIAISKFAAAAITGSSAMLSEGIHSVVDCGNQGLILFGLRHAKRPPDEKHPFGYGMELYFWTFIVAIMIFAVGAGISIYEGIERLRHPAGIESPFVNYVVLALAMVFEGFAWWVAYKEFQRTRGGQNWFAAVRQSKDPTVFTVLFEDTAAMLGLVVAFVGVLSADVFGMTAADGIASIAIGVVLALTAIFLAIESKALLIGESADPAVVAGIRTLFDRHPRVSNVNEVLSMHLGPSDILVAASLDFVDTLLARDVEETISEFERQTRSSYPSVRRVFIEAQGWRASQEAAHAIKAETAKDTS